MNHAGQICSCLDGRDACNVLPSEFVKRCKVILKVPACTFLQWFDNFCRLFWGIDAEKLLALNMSAPVITVKHSPLSHPIFGPELFSARTTGKGEVLGFLTGLWSM